MIIGSFISKYKSDSKVDGDEKESKSQITDT